MNFNPTRLTLARKRRGLTKSELAKAIGVDLRAVSAFEAGEYPPAEQTLFFIQKALAFPSEFFLGESLEEPLPDAASFRALSKMTASQRDMALGQGALALHLNAWLESHYTLPLPELADLGRVTKPEEAADTLRQIWGIGELPIRNMIHLLEAKGVRIFSLAIDAREVDAFSMWKDSTPFIFLNTQKSSEHGRFDAAHELGHLVLHRHSSPEGREAERQADSFASAFLMPRGSVLAHARPFLTLPDILRLKKIWNVSAAALAYRLHVLELLSDWQYRTLCIEIAKRGYRQTEPDSAPRETSLILPKLFSALQNDGISRVEVARMLGIPQSELEQLMFGLAISALQGGRTSDNTTSHRAKLRLIQK